MARITLSDRADLPFNIFRALVNSPPVARGLSSMGGRLLAETKLDPKIRELVIDAISVKLDAPYEWSHHVKPALDLGATPEELQALKDDDLAKLGPLERTCVEYAKKVDDRTVTDADVDGLKQAGLDDQEIVELTVLTGFYGMVAKFLLAMDVELDEAGVPNFDIPAEASGAAQELIDKIQPRGRSQGNG